MKRFVLSSLILLFLLPALAWSGEVEDFVKQLGSESFQEREEAQGALMLRISTQAKAIEKEALRVYPDPESDPETRMRLLKVLELLAKETSFEEKNGFIGLTIGPGNAFVPDGDGKGRTVVPAVIVMSVMEEMQGAKAGMKDRDQIFEINGKPFDPPPGPSTTLQFMKRIGFTAPGKKVELAVMRDGKRMDLSVELMKRPEGLPPGYYDEEKDFEEFFGKWLEEKTADR